MMTKSRVRGAAPKTARAVRLGWMLGLAIFGLSLSLHAQTTYYLCSTGNGSAPTDGTCANAYDEADINTASNWTESGGSPIAPGDTIRLMADGGTFSQLTPYGGATGNPVILEPNGTDVVTVENTEEHVILVGSCCIGYLTFRAGSGTFNVNYLGGNPVSIKVAMAVNKPEMTVDGLIINGTDANPTYGIQCGEDGIIRNNTVTNFYSGIFVSGNNCVISGNTVNSNFNGIARNGEPGVIRTDISIIGNTTANNGNSGILWGDADRWLIEDNITHTNTATGIQVEIEVTNGIVRGNTAYNNSRGTSNNESGIWIDEAQDILVEGNISHGQAIGLSLTETSRVIARNNILYNNDNGPAGSYFSAMRGGEGSGTAPWKPGDHHYVYNNTLYDNGLASQTISGSIVPVTGPGVADQVYKNNAILSSQADDEVNSAAGNTQAVFLNNHWFHASRALNFFWGGSNINAATWDGTTQDASEIANGSTTPFFTNAAAADFTLQATSPLIDAGGALTTVSSTGAGTITVADSHYFTDGYGISGESGDVIAIFSSDWATLRGTTTVTAINHGTGVLTATVPGGTVSGDFVVYSKDFGGTTLTDRPEIGAYFQTAPAATTYYVSPTGTGSACTMAAPCLPASVWILAGPGDTITFADGVYQGANEMIDPPDDFDGTAGNRITIQATNDGEVWIDGQDVRIPLSLYTNDYVTVTGINASNSNAEACQIVFSDHVTLSRVICWDASPTANNHVISVRRDTENILLEDVAWFGTGRKGLEIFDVDHHQTTGNVTIRRAWGQWEYSEQTGPKQTTELMYNARNTLVENSILTIDQQPGTNTTELVGAFATYAPASNADRDSNFRMYGNIAYMENGLTYTPTDFNTLGFMDNMTIEDFAVFLGTDYTTKRPVNLANCRTYPAQAACTTPTMNLTNVSLIGGTTSVIGSDWTQTNVDVGANVAAVYPTESLWANDGTKGATFCLRYEGGVLTEDPIFENDVGNAQWPMNVRIDEALVDAGKSAIDLTGLLEGIFGAVDSSCIEPEAGGDTSITVTGPVPGSPIKIGNVVPITWTSNFTTGTFTIQWSNDCSTNFGTIATAAYDAETYNWTVDAPSGSTGCVRIFSGAVTDDGSVLDIRGVYGL